MKKVLYIVIATLLCGPLNAKRPKNPKPGRAENAQLVISNLAQIIGQIGNIIENPHNPEQVGDSVSNMVDNVIKITVNAVQNKSLSIAQASDILDELHYLCENFDTKLIENVVRTKNTLVTSA